jgi:Fe-Mn family superoxide dismutase
MSESISRRNALKTIGLGALAASLSCAAGGSALADDDPAIQMPPPAPRAYELPPLPYAFGALQPVLDEKLVRIHYARHSAGYFRGLNATLKDLEAARAAGEFSRIRALSRDLAFNGSGAVLHALYWMGLKPGEQSEPKGTLAAAINRDFGSPGALRRQLLEAAKHVHGSGWGILAFEPVGRRLLVLQAENHQNMTIWGVQPLLAIDVWEHAYYLQYENRRAEYLEKIFTIINWPAVSARYATLLP